MHALSFELDFDVIERIIRKYHPEPEDDDFEEDDLDEDNDE